QRGVEQRLRSRGLDDIDSRRRRNREVRRQQRHLGSALARLLGERDAHATRGAVAEKTDRVERLAGAARADEHAASGERVGLAEQLAATPKDLLGLGHPPESPLALRRLALVRSGESSAAGDRKSTRLNSS